MNKRSLFPCFLCFCFSANFITMSVYSLSEDLVLLKAAVEDQEDTEDSQLLLAYASMGLVAVGTTASVWMCLRQTFDLRREEQVRVK